MKETEYDNDYIKDNIKEESSSAYLGHYGQKQ
jgi:hypothetical protein